MKIFSINKIGDMTLLVVDRQGSLNWALAFAKEIGLLHDIVEEHKGEVKHESRGPDGCISITPEREDMHSYSQKGDSRVDVFFGVKRSFISLRLSQEEKAKLVKYLDRTAEIVKSPF